MRFVKRTLCVGLGVCSVERVCVCGWKLWVSEFWTSGIVYAKTEPKKKKKIISTVFLIQFSQKVNRASFDKTSSPLHFRCLEYVFCEKSQNVFEAILCII